MLLTLSMILLLLWLAGLFIFHWGSASYILLLLSFCIGILAFIGSRKNPIKK